jgi:thiol-disulfide isomerase/thioredoxin
MIIATRLRVLVLAGWTGAVIGPSYGARLVVQLLTQTLTIDLGVLVIAAVAIWAAAGPRRELGRSFDLACVAVLPLVIADLVHGIIVHVAGVALGRPMTWAATALALGWTAALVALAVLEVRRRSPICAGGRAGWLLVALAAAATAYQVAWISQHTAVVRPMAAGEHAPPFALPAIGPGGQLGPTVTIVPGKITVIDFWATWCPPCVASMPQLAAFVKRHPDIAVYAVSLDEQPEQARAFFDQRGITATLLADDHDTSARFGAETIPHTVIIDREGRVRLLNGLDLEAAITALR